MPVITLEMAPLTIEQKRELAQELTNSAAKITGLPKESFYVFIRENCLDNLGVGGELLSDKQKITTETSSPCASQNQDSTHG